MLQHISRRKNLRSPALALTACISSFTLLSLAPGCGPSKNNAPEQLEAQTFSTTARNWKKLENCPQEILGMRQNKEYQGRGGITLNRLPIRTEEQGNFLVTSQDAAEWILKGPFTLLISPINAKLTLAGREFKFTNGTCYTLNAGTSYELPAAVYEIPDTPGMFLMIEFNPQEDSRPRIVPIDLMLEGKRAKFLVFNNP